MNVIGLLPILGSLAAGLVIAATLLTASSAPQQAAGMAMACAFAVTAYVLARGLEMADMADSKATQFVVVGAIVVGALLMVAAVPILPGSGSSSELQRARELDAIDRLERERVR